ncbi:MAG: 6-phosphogluconolactonase [Kiritimatiellaeota bacterium]|nr:6-phosphogluconolactonase [Kiritimatiellota bacterium]
MTPRRFLTREELDRALAHLLLSGIRAPSAGPYALLLAGGLTPLAAYRLGAETLRRERRTESPPAGLYLTFTDERMVPDEAPESNYNNARPLIAALGLPPGRVLRVATALPLPAAAQRWHDDLAAFFARGGMFTLGLLGLGADGHTASLFSRDDLARGRGRWVIPVLRESGPCRVSVTPDLLTRVQRLVFIAAGPDKVGVVERLLRAPETLPAGLAVVAAPRVEVWFSPTE